MVLIGPRLSSYRVFLVLAWQIWTALESYHAEKLSCRDDQEGPVFSVHDMTQYCIVGLLTREVLCSKMLIDLLSGRINEPALWLHEVVPVISHAQPLASIEILSAVW